LSRDFDAFSGVEYTRVLLSDFGQCESMLRNQQLPRTGFTGTMLYAAPELLKKDGDYDHSCDIYSLGILIYALAYGSAPYQDMMDASQEELYAKIMHDKRVSIPDFPRRSRDLVDLIHFLTHPDRFKRPSVDDIMNDPRFIMRISRQKFSSSSAHSGIPDILDESRNPTQTLLPSPKFSAPLLALPIAQNTRNEKQSVIPSTRAHSDSEIPEEKIIAALEPIEHKNLERPSKRQKSNLDFRSTIFIFFAILKLWAIEKSCNGNPSNEVERYGSIIFALVPLIIGRTNIMGYSSDFHLVTLGFMWSLLCQYMKFSCTPESLSNSHFIILLLQLIALLILKNFRS
jgi:serine/threonine protein kinase